VVHRLRGRPSNRKIAPAMERQAMGIVKREYSDFGPTLAAEYLKREHRIAVSRETLRQWMMRAGLWHRRKQQVEQVHIWRQRRSCLGELVQWDTSDHDWLEGRGPRLQYIAMIDDATSRVLSRFAEQDTTKENMRLLWAYLLRFGRPVDYYSDRDSMFYSSRQKRDGELESEPEKTQIGRALEELGIGWIGARSPPAKGRIERHFDTAQDRLVKGLRKAGVCTREGANAYLEREFLPWVERRLSCPPANPVDAHRPLGKQHDLAAILSRVEYRTVGNDYTMRIQAQRYQIDRGQIRPGLKEGLPCESATGRDTGGTFPATLSDHSEMPLQPRHCPGDATAGCGATPNRRTEARLEQGFRSALRPPDLAGPGSFRRQAAAGVVKCKQRQSERRAKPARRSSRLLCPKASAPELHQKNMANPNPPNQNPLLRILTRGFWPLADFFGASSVASALDLRRGRDPVTDRSQSSMGSVPNPQNRNFLLCRKPELSTLR